MNDQDFEWVMAYHDGELDPGQVAKVEQLLAECEEARMFLDQLKQSDNFLRGGLDKVLEQPVPKQLVDSARGESRQRAKVLGFPRWRSISPWAYATAASVSLLVAAGTYMLSDQPGSALSDRLAQALNESLETTVSGEVYRAPDQSLQVMPMATFRTDTVGVCRQYAAQVQGKQSVGLACRQQAAQWHVRVQQDLPSGGPSQAYSPASGGEGVIADEIESIGGGPPIDREREQALIKNGWR